MVRTATRYSVGNVVFVIAAVIAGIILLGILLVFAGANQANGLVDFILDLGRFFAAPFDDLFPKADPKQNMLVNWGIAALFYLAVGVLVGRFARRY
jgi:hypothetical protein